MLLFILQNINIEFVMKDIFENYMFVLASDVELQIQYTNIKYK